ncbi:MAG TPA: carbohydrate hydrolase [Chloroflexi bacterium]|nr:carbohydrate hydrolase [Chloroflexota bacterium]
MDIATVAGHTSTGTPALGTGTFLGYRRPDGTVGIRNHLAIIPSVICANTVTERIAAQVPGAIALPHPHGCAQVGDDVGLTERILAGAGANPNVGAVLVIGLGCETCQSNDVASLIRTLAPGRPVVSFSIQEAGGSIKSITRGVEVARELAAQIANLPRVPVSLDELIVATQCGESDHSTDTVSNPIVGEVVDHLVDLGARVIMGETTDWMDFEDHLSTRAATPEIGARIHAVTSRFRRDATANGAIVIGHEADDDVLTGETTIQARALGCLAKGGSRPIQDVLDFGVRPSRPGLSLMDTPPHDAVSVTAMAAAGAHICLFTTGRGTPVGNAIIPVVKLTANPFTATRMGDNIDLSVVEAGHGASRTVLVEALQALLVDVCNGAETVAEIIGHQDFAIHRVAPTV